MAEATAQRATVTRDEILGLANGKDSYRFLSAALRALTQLPADTELRLHVFRHYSMLGLLGPALEAAAAFPQDVLDTPEIHAAIEQFKRLPSGRTPWDRFRDRFRANLAALTDRLPDAQSIEQAWERRRDRIELYQCRDGNFQFSTLDDRGCRVWLPLLADHRAAAQQTEVRPDPTELLCSPYLIEGLGLGWILERVARATAKTFLTYRPAVYVLEPNPIALAAVLHLHDWRELLGDPRVHVFAGPDCHDRFVRAMLSNDELPLPRQCIRMARWGPDLKIGGPALCEQVSAARIAQARSLLSDAATVYKDRDVRFWARRYAEADERDPLRVVFVVSRHTTYLKYCIRDVAAAFEARGARTRTLIESTDFGKTSPAAYLRTVRDFRPDLFFVIDHFRREYPGVIPENVPFVGWIQDLLPNIYSRECGRSLGPLDFYVAPGLSTLVRQYDFPASRGMAWTMATDDRVYSADPLPEEEIAGSRCDFSYVSNQSRLPRAFHEERRQMFRDDRSAARVADRLFETITRELVETPATACGAPGIRLYRAKQKLGLASLSPQAEERLLNFYLHPLTELMFRQSALEWVADYCDRTGRTLHLYGNGWEQHPRFAKYARGFAQNGQELRAIYQATRINLQIVNSGAVHQRLLDGLAAGGFFLLRYTPADVMDGPVRRYLQAVRKYGVALDTDYDPRDVPDLVSAIEEQHRLLDSYRPNERVRVRSECMQAYQEMEACGYRRVAGAVFPEYRDVAFATAGELERRAERFLHDGPERRRIAESMRAAVVDRYFYGAFVDDLLAFMRKRLSGQSRSRGDRWIDGLPGGHEG